LKVDDDAERVASNELGDDEPTRTTFAGMPRAPNVAG